MKLLVFSALILFCFGAEHVSATPFKMQHHNDTVQEFYSDTNNAEKLSYEAASAPETTDSKRQLCLFWGLIGNCGFKASVAVESSLDTGEEPQGEMAELHGETRQHEYRSVLWGAVQWRTRNTAVAPADAESADAP